MMLDDVWPAIVAQYGGIVGTVVVQMDNASPHVGKGMVDRLEKAFARMKREKTDGSRAPVEEQWLIPNIVVTTQPAQSPDTNICDLAFFSASQAAVQKRRREQGHAFDVDKLEDDVEKVFNQYPVESLCKMWNTKARVLQKIVYAKGGNDYKLHGDVVAPHTRGVPKWKFNLYDVGK